MYYYIKHVGDDRNIELCKTEDILSIPDTAEIIDESEIGVYFPQYLTHSHLAIKHTILHGKFAGTYVLPISTYSKGRLLNYDVIAREFKAQHQNALSYYATMSCENSTHRINGLLQHYEFDTGDINERVTTNESILKLLDAYSERRYGSMSDSASKIIRTLNNEINGNVVKEAIFKVHEQLPNITGVAVKGTADDLYNQVNAQIKKWREGEYRLGIDPIHISVGFNSVLCIHVTKARSHNSDDFTISISWVKDVEAVSKHWRSTLVGPARAQLSDFILDEIANAANAIANPASGITYEEVAVIRPIDKKKSTRVKFLKLLHKLKIYSTLTTARNHIEAIYIKQEAKAASDMFSIWRYYYRSHGWHQSQVISIIGYLGTLTNIDDFINEQIKKESKVFTKKQIRKLLFAQIRVLLQYQPKSKVN